MHWEGNCAVILSWSVGTNLLVYHRRVSVCRTEYILRCGFYCMFDVKWIYTVCLFYCLWGSANIVNFSVQYAWWFLTAVFLYALSYVLLQKLDGIGVRFSGGSFASHILFLLFDGLSETAKFSRLSKNFQTFLSMKDFCSASSLSRRGGKEEGRFIRLYSFHAGRLTDVSIVTMIYETNVCVGDRT